MNLHWPLILYPLREIFRESANLALGRVYPLCRSENVRPFFIVGCGRSGNTLLRRILHASPGVHIPPETYVLGQAIDLYRRNACQPWPVLVNLVLSLFEFVPGFVSFRISLRPLAGELYRLPESERSLARIFDSLYRYHGERCGKTSFRWGDKTPVNTFALHSIARVFPDAQYIHMLRDGVDAAFSHVEWGLLPDLRIAAEHWKRSVNLANAFAASNPGACLTVRYETLVSEPVSTVAEACRFLGIPFQPHMLEPPADSEGLGDVADLSHHKKVLAPISPDRVGNARRQSSTDQRKLLRSIIGPDLVRLGYEPI